MYQIIVIGLGLSLLLGGGYYVAKTDNQQVLGLSLSDTPIYTLPTADEIAGTYTCDKTTGCANPYSLILDTDGIAALNVTYGDGVETRNEQGTWGFKEGGFISLSLSGSTTGNYATPHAFLIQSVSSTTLSKYVYDGKQYDDMIKPVFTRVEE